MAKQVKNETKVDSILDINTVTSTINVIGTPFTILEVLFRLFCDDTKANQMKVASICKELGYIKKKSNGNTMWNVSTTSAAINQVNTIRNFSATDVVITDNNLFTTTLAIAECSDNAHSSVIKLVRTYQADLEEFGRVRFKISTFNTNGGQQAREYAMLNQEQTTLLVTYMRNTPIIRQFKMTLVKTFSEMSAELNKNTQSLPTTYKEVLQHLLMNLEQTEKLELSLKQAQPAINHYQQTIESKSGMLVEAFSKVLGYKDIGRNKMFALLRKHGYLTSNNLPIQRYLDSGLFCVIETFKNGYKHQTSLITSKGEGELSAFFSIPSNRIIK